MTRTVTDPLRHYRIATCILKAAHDLFEGHEIPWFNRAGVTAKGGDWECADCSGLFVWLDASEPLFNLDGTCMPQRRYRYIVETGRCVNEKLSGCDGDHYGPAIPETCPEDLDAVLQSGCGPDVKPHEEAAFLWRDRTVLETMLAPSVSCCVHECLMLRCKSVDLERVSQETSGACHFVRYELAFTF